MTWRKKLAKAKKIKIRLIVDKFIAAEPFEEEYMSTHKQYELAALIMQENGESDAAISEPFLRAAWTADDDKNDSLANHYRQLAASYLKKVLTEEKDKTRIAEMQFRLAEIYRRSSEFQLAIETLKENKNECIAS